MKRLAALAAMVMVLSGCDYMRSSDCERKQTWVESLPKGKVICARLVQDSITRFWDREAGAICWVAKSGSGVAITCLPDSQLRVAP